jgi:hypothetical protein
MPVILPPDAFEVPAIIRVAAHAPASPATTHAPAPRGQTVPVNPGPQPLGGGEGPAIVSPSAPVVPVSPPPPPPATTTSSSAKTR